MIAIGRAEPDALRERLVALHELSFPEIELGLSALDTDQDVLLFVAQDDELLVGYVLATQTETGVINVWEHVVHPSYRHQGMGKAMLAQLTREVDQTAKLLIDPAGALDPDRALDYYGKLGFAAHDSDGQLWAEASAVRALVR